MLELMRDVEKLTIAIDSVVLDLASVELDIGLVAADNASDMAIVLVEMGWADIVGISPLDVVAVPSTTGVREPVPIMKVSVEASEAKVALKVAMLAEDVPEVLLEDEDETDLDKPAGQVKSYNGVVESLLPTTPKSGELVGTFGNPS